MPPTSRFVLDNDKLICRQSRDGIPAPPNSSPSAPTSRAACARHRLGRKTADRHYTLMGRFDRMQTELNDITTRIFRLHDAHTLLPAATLSAVIADVARASSLCRALCTAVFTQTTSRAFTFLHDATSAVSEARDAFLRPLVDPRVFFRG
ncbi:hypothetical protein GGX14DRAFT_567078 [Mycena pura]|uniref:Uncharacterized protein n=1 Tax=Mycena pura TaxID=153505 RepID=A0AAD6VBN1_9AGAR|nr:hypothetical protein GGX14DRAFT_567078 [Mycena pura]